jgi:hypothetical protein
MRNITRVAYVDEPRDAVLQGVAYVHPPLLIWFTHISADERVEADAEGSLALWAVEYCLCRRPYKLRRHFKRYWEMRFFYSGGGHALGK